jgi:MSHA biogenesis protein MshQ
VVAPIASRYRAVASGGNFNLYLAAPGAGDSGALSVTATAPAWLQYSWSGSSNPVGLATFGVFPGPAARVHQREVY